MLRLSAMSDYKKERTLILGKPDALVRGLIGEIIKRFEQRGYKLVAMKMTKADADHVRNHYQATEEQLGGMGNKTLENYGKFNKDVQSDFGTIDPMKIGEIINSWNVDFLTSGPIVAMVFQGLHAVEIGRKMVGHTFPSYADMGTIRGDFSLDSPMLANDRKKSVKNLVHASGSIEEAQREIKHWFNDDELHEYKRVDEELMLE